MDISPDGEHAVLAQLSTGGAQSFLADNIVPLVLLFVGVVLMTLAAKADLGKIVTVIVGVLMALGVVGISVIPGGAPGVAQFVAELFTGG